MMRTTHLDRKLLPWILFGSLLLTHLGFSVRDWLFETGSSVFVTQAWNGPSGELLTAPGLPK